MAIKVSGHELDLCAVEINRSNVGVAELGNEEGQAPPVFHPGWIRARYAERRDTVQLAAIDIDHIDCADTFALRAERDLPAIGRPCRRCIAEIAACCGRQSSLPGSIGAHYIDQALVALPNTRTLGLKRDRSAIGRPAWSGIALRIIS